MSYCRSGEDSDVYVYGTKDTIYCHVKYNNGKRWNILPLYMHRKVGIIRTLLVHFDFSKFNTKKFKNHYAGRTFTAERPGTMAYILTVLRSNGVKVPQRAIDRLREEQADED